MANEEYTYSLSPLTASFTRYRNTCVLTPPIKLALAIDLPLPGYALLETKGRKSGTFPTATTGNHLGGRQRRAASHCPRLSMGTSRGGGDPQSVEGRATTRMEFVSQNEY